VSCVSRSTGLHMSFVSAYYPVFLVSNTAFKNVGQTTEPVQWFAPRFKKVVFDPKRQDNMQKQVTWLSSSCKGTPDPLPEYFKI